MSSSAAKDGNRGQAVDCIVEPSRVLEEKPRRVVLNRFNMNALNHGMDCQSFAHQNCVA